MKCPVDHIGQSAALHRVGRVTVYGLLHGPFLCVTLSLRVTASKRAEPRIPFGQLVERRLLEPGEVLVSANGRHTARVRADGSLVAARTTGSIHKVGAELEGAPSCNGWTYWHFRKEGKDISIDVLRQQIRSEMN